VRVSPYPHLEKLDIGCVQYLNAKPLIHGFEGKVIFDHPSRLAEMLSEGLLDVALVPTFRLLHEPDFLIVNDVSISSNGPVYSVFLAYHGDLEKVKKIALDTASLTSVHLLQCLLSEYHRMAPEYVTSHDCPDENAARLLIGNQAIDFRRKHGDEWKYLDLGEEWTLRTSLPFVFAAWLIRRGVVNAVAVAEELRALKRSGIESIPEIVRHQNHYDEEFAMRYLTGHIRYDLGEAEKAAIQKFRELLTKHGFISNMETALVFV
jgi:chorismate dehydratase